MPDISRLAVVEKTARLAEGVRVGPFCYIGPEATIGEGCVIESGASIVGRTTLAARCHVFPLAVIGARQAAKERVTRPAGASWARQTTSASMSLFTAGRTNPRRSATTISS